MTFGMMLCCIYEVGCNAGDVLQAKACPSINGRAVCGGQSSRSQLCVKRSASHQSLLPHILW